MSRLDGQFELQDRHSLYVNLQVYYQVRYAVLVWGSEHERAILSWAHSMTKTSLVKVDDSACEALQALMCRDDMANLTLAITQINAWNRQAKAYRFEVGHHQVGE
ncbi:MAG: alkylhydroperoxidase family enzyme [Flavobacteriales bacterium]|jgi:alkylhydroperoxidase family enzyme